MNPIIYICITVGLAAIGPIVAFSLWALIAAVGDKSLSGFKFLSKTTVENRKLICGLRRAVSKLEHQVWDLEDHSSEETIERTARLVKEYGEVADALAGNQLAKDESK